MYLYCSILVDLEKPIKPNRFSFIVNLTLSYKLKSDPVIVNQNMLFVMSDEQIW